MHIFLQILFIYNLNEKDIKSYLKTFQTVFAKGGGHSLDVQAKLGYETLGLDWTVDPTEARKIVGDNITLQGNLDPQDLYKTPVRMLFILCNLGCRFTRLSEVIYHENYSFTYYITISVMIFLHFTFTGGNKKVNNRYGAEVRQTQIHS